MTIYVVEMIGKEMFSEGKVYLLIHLSTPMDLV